MTIVEVVIAMIVLMVVATAVGMATVDGSKQRGVTRLQSAMTAAGQHVQEDVIADRAWMKEVSGCRVIDNPCSIKDYVSADSLELTDVEADAVLVRATATALDSRVDQLGANDEDGVIPDYYRIAIELQVAPRDASRLRIDPANSARRFVTTIDRRGAEQVGSVEVEVCRVVNQADERMNIQGCRETGRTHVSMLNCEPTAPSCDASRPEVYGDCAPGSTIPCRQAFNWINHFAESNAATAAPAPFVSLQRVAPGTISFRLVDQSTGAQIPSSQAKLVDGMYVFQNVPAGEFKLAGLPGTIGGNSERWDAKELPGFHGSPSRAAGRSTIAVDPGIQSRALVMFRPAMSTDGIDLTFKRKTRTFQLKGPFTATETSVAPYAPTDGYQGQNAASYCGLMQNAETDTSQFTTYDCVSIAPSGKNCVDLFVEGEYFKDVGEGNGDTRFLYPDVITGLPGSGNYLIKHTNGPTRAMRFCSYYAEYLTHTYYGQVNKTPPWDTRDGAAEANTYKVEDAPRYRHLETDDSTGTYPMTPQCVVQFKGQCSIPNPSKFTPELGDGLFPGLNTRMEPSSASAAARNDFFSGTPNWLTKPLWVRPDGNIVPSDGSGVKPAGIDVTLTGKGECYWRGPLFGGTRESNPPYECNPCRPQLASGAHASACALLTKTAWVRPAWERYTSYDWMGDGTGTQVGPYLGIETKKGTIPYSPWWWCTGMVPEVENGGSCKAPPTGGGGPKGINGTRHKASAPGTSAAVGGNPFDGKPRTS